MIDIAMIKKSVDTEGNDTYMAEYTRLPGCMSHGYTPMEALVNLQDAKALYLGWHYEV